MAANDTDRSWVEISESALRHNLHAVREQIGLDAKIISVVKANAYGHGVELVHRALSEQTDLFAVANLTEALELQSFGCRKPILLLSPSLPVEYAAIASAGFIPTISSVQEAEAYQMHASGSQHLIHFAVDSGMGRIGTWIQDAMAQIVRIAQMPHISIHSISTHLPSADEDGVFTKTQLEQFAEFCDTVKAQFPYIACHALNSAGIQQFSDYALDMVRPGLMLYGATSVRSFREKLKPVLSWKARVLLVRDIPAGRSISYGRTFVTPSALRAATLSVGYADGYPWQSSSRHAAVLLGGKHCRILGRVTMDQIVVDAIGADVKPGDIATLIGSDGEETIRAEEVAERALTIAWDVFTAIGQRVQRIAVE
ncbi:MAG: alanine racemase [Chthoniobacterales bacterium]